jgi:hypothetical protein
MSDYFVCFRCHQRFVIALIDRWLDHQFRCSAESPDALSNGRSNTNDLPDADKVLAGSHTGDERTGD